MEKGIRLMTKRATGIMEQIAEDIKALMLMPHGTPEAEKEKAWGEISDKYQKFAKQNNLNPHDLDQFKKCVMQHKWDEFKNKLMEWGSAKAQTIEDNGGSLEHLEDDDLLIAIGQIHTLVVANLLIEFLHFNGAID